MFVSEKKYKKMEDSDLVAVVKQSLDRRPTAAEENERRRPAVMVRRLSVPNISVSALDPRGTQALVAEESWWTSPFKSYYPQLCWGRLNSLIQPLIDNHFSGSEVIKGLWISDHASVCDLLALQDRGIKHVICAVLGVKAMFPRDIRYTRLPLRDTTDEDIYKYFDEVATLIHESLVNKEAVLVHCRKGVSRSVTLVCAYLIRFHNMTHEEALHIVQKSRPCANPIQSFRNQLRSYEGRQGGAASK